MDDAQLYWHFLPDSGFLNHDMSDVKAVPGLSIELDGDLEINKRGLHACLKPLDALKYAPGALVSQVTLGGTIIKGDGLCVASERTIVWMADATRVLHEFAIWCAEQALALIDEPDARSVEALKVKRQWLDGKATDDELTVARDAAWGATWGASGKSAWSATWGASGKSASTAAWAAAGPWRGGWDTQNEQLSKMLLKLIP